MRQVFLCALLLAGPAVQAAPQAAPQTPPAPRDPMRFIYAAEWHGEAAVVIQGKQGNDTIEQRFSTKFRIEMPVGYRAIYEQMKVIQKQFPNGVPAQVLDVYKKTLSEFTWTRAVGKKEETYELTVHNTSGETSYTAGPLTQTRDAQVFLKMDVPGGTYELWVDTTDPLEITSTTKGKSTKLTERAFPGRVQAKKQALPTDKEVLTGRIPIDGASSVPNLTMKADNLTSWFEWTLSPELLTPLELNVDIPDYEKWLPEGKQDGFGVGNTLEVKAELRAKGGGALKNEKCVKIAFYLPEISTEPGSAMNAPADGGREYDLRFDGALNPGLKIDPQGNRASTTSPGPQATAKISCLDFGAWAVLQVYAYTDLGRYVEGTTALLPGETRIRLPKRAKDSKIADEWKKGSAARQAADDSDNDAQPAGNGTAGDGLTLYEEYRGFFVDGKHLRSDPEKKDLFVETRTNHAKVKDGVKMFEKATGLEVHLAEKETLLKDRRINFNFHSGHGGDQHGILIMGFNPALKGICYTRPVAGVESPSSPKEVQQIELAPDVAKLFPAKGTWSGSTVTGPDQLTSGLAHELCHSVGIAHHGDDWDYAAVWKVRQAGAANIFDVTEAANNVEKKITVIREDGKPYPWTKEQDITVSIGVLGGVDSGAWDCLMRYENANAYVFSKDPSVRVDVHGDEVGGTTLCTSKKGTGSNDAARAPYDRFGDARKGNCAGQLRVKDWGP